MPKPLNAQQVSDLVAMLKDPPADEVKTLEVSLKLLSFDFS